MDFQEAEKGLRQFSKVESSSTGRGLKYEHNMCSLAFARTTRLKYDFSLASNLEGCGALDDVVLQFTKHDGKKRCFFVQMKSKAKTTVGFGSLLAPPKSSDFSLLKYFESYLEIKNNFKNRNDTPFDGEFDEILFVLYTNSDVTGELKNRLNESRKDAMVSDAGDILLTNKENGGSTLQLKLDGKIHDALVKALIEAKEKKTMQEKDKTAKKGNKCVEKTEENAKGEIQHVQETGNADKENKSIDETEKHANKQKSIDESKENASNENEFVDQTEENASKESESIDETVKRIREQETKNQVEEFLRKLVIMYKQTEEERFDDVIKEELRQHVTFLDEELQLAHAKFQQLFQEWWLKNYFLDSWNKKNPIIEVFEYVKSEVASQFIKHRRTDVENLDIMFVDSAFNCSREIVENNQVVLMYSPKYTTQPTLAKINQFLPRIANHAILNLRDLVQNVECIMIAWKRAVFEILVIDVCEVQCRLDVTLSRIQQVVKEDEIKKVIFVSAYGRHMNYMKIIKKLFKAMLKFTQDTLRYPDLSVQTRKSFLDKKVIFQGQTLLLSELIDDTDLAILNELDEKSLSLLLSNEIPVIGSELEVTLNYYIGRILEVSRTVSENILKEEGAVFAIDNKTSEKLRSCPSILSNQSSKFVLVEKSSDFEDISSTNVHWLISDGNRLVWKQSKGDLDVIRRHLIPHDVTEWKPKTVLEGDDRFTLLTAEPGMGKSSLLTHLAKITKMKHPDMWVIRININNFTKILEDIKKEGFHEEKAVEMLELAAGIKDPKSKSLETGLFEKAYAHEGNVAVLIDGIDEVSPSYIREAIKIVRFFYDTEVSKIWVTSRIFMKRALEEEFGIPSYSLVPFNKQEQELFLVKFWKLNHPDKDEEVLKRLASKIRRLVASQFKDHETDFMGIPIQGLLLAEISSSFNNPTIENINLYTLYELYVEKKWDIYLKEKMNADTTNVMVSHDTSAIYRNFIDNHKAAAVVAFLKVDVLEDINNSKMVNQANAFVQNVRNGIEKTGIIHSVNDAGQAVFVHRTFCEYFVALWVFDNLMCNHPRNQMLLNFDMHSENVKPVLGKIFDDGFKVVKSILERMLAKGFDIHSAILNDNEADFKKALENRNCNEQDYGGRTPLHVASSCGNNNFVRILLDHGADESRLDTLLGISSVTYAIRAEHWKTLAEILDKRPASRERELDVKTLGNIYFMIPILRCAKENENLDLLRYLTEEKGWILLHAGVRLRHIEFTELVLSIGTLVNVPNVEGRTGLHIASENNDFSIARLLIMKGAAVNSTDNSGISPLHVAVERSSHALIQLLLHNGAEINLKTTEGFTSLHIASKTGDLESANLLLNSGADVNSSDNNGYTPLHLAAQHGHQISQLLNHGAAVDFPSEDGSYPLHIASRYGQVDVVRVLLSHKVAVNIVDKNGKSPLHLACENGYNEVARMLMDNGALVNMRDGGNCTSLMLADRNGLADMRELLLSHGAVEEKAEQVNKVEEQEDNQSKLERETARIARQVHDEGNRFLRRVRKLF